MINLNKELYNKAESIEFGENTFEKITLGGHKCVVLNVSEYTNPNNGNVSLKICFDTAKDDTQPAYFKGLYDEDTRPDKKWSNNAIRYVSLKEENYSYLKGTITAFENSNPGFKFDLDSEQGWNQLVGKNVAVQFGNEEYTKSDGTVGLIAKIRAIRSLDKLNTIVIPDVKTLNGEFIPQEVYDSKKAEEKENNAKNIFGSDGIDFTTGDLPF